MHRHSPLEPLAPPLSPPSRHTARPLPAYRHVPGLTPHPVNDPAGHSHGLVEAPPELPAAGLPAGWRRCEPYLYGVDLFNRAFFWEAHEEWEGLWHAVGHGSVPGRFLQGLIQFSAALLQRHRGRERGARYLTVRAAEHLEPARRVAARGGRGRYMGVDLEAWPRAVRRFLADDGGAFPFLVLADPR